MKRKTAKTAYWIQHTHLFRRDEYVCSACREISCKAYGICPSCNSQMLRSKYDPSWVDEAEMMSAILDDDW